MAIFNFKSEEGSKHTLDSVLQHYDFIVQVRNFNFSETSWRWEFKEAISGWEFILEEGELFSKNYHRDKNGSLIEGRPFDKVDVGYYVFLSVDEVDVPDHLKLFPCPFITTNFGYYCVKFNWNIDLESLKDHFLGMIKESMGTIIAKKEGELIYYSCVDEIEDSMWLGKYAFEDGSVLLSRENEDYLDYIIEKIRTELRKHNYDVHIYYGPSCHNPIRYNYFVKLSGEGASELYSTDEKKIEEEEMEAEVLNSKIKFWAFNFDDPLRRKFYGVLHWGTF